MDNQDDKAVSESFERITADDLVNWIKAGRGIALIDTLPADHFERVHLPGAFNACVYDVSFVDQVVKLGVKPSMALVLYGASTRGLEAETAAQKLRDAGWTNVYVLAGGLEAWRAGGQTLEGLAPGEVDAPQPDVRVPDGIYEVDSSQSSIEWAGRNPNTRHHGTVAISEGRILVKQGTIQGSLTIDMTRIRNISLAGDPLQPVLLDHLASDDFFLTKRFPSATFTIERADMVDNPSLGIPNYEVKGTLALRGVKAKITLSATVSKLADGRFCAEAHFDLDRTRWGVIYGSSRFFEHLGMHLVFDPISMQVRIVTR